MKSRPTIAVPILAALAILLVVGAYVGGYFWLGEHTEIPFSFSKKRYVRAYRQAWLATIYQPVGKVESWLTKTDIKIYHRTGDIGPLEEWAHYSEPYSKPAP